MKIASIELKKSSEGLSAFSKISLGKVVVVAGSNGSGKTRLLRHLERYVKNLSNGEDDNTLSLQISYEDQDSVPLTKENVNQLQLVNYSHFDAQLQLPENFTPYVICQAKKLLGTCDYEETALNSLLFLEDMVKGYSDEFQDGRAFDEFIKKFAEPFQLVVQKDTERHLRLFDQTAKNAHLSPGQQYLLRIAVACYQNQNNEHMVFLLDEPELHLHPKAQIELIKALRAKFPETQFWICTHSLTLIAYLAVSEADTTVLYMQNGQTDIFRSNSSSILEGLIGAEENRFAIRQLLGTPDEYACNKFAVECFKEPDVFGATNGNDPQVGMLGTIFHPNDVVVDFGAGKGRVLGELSLGSYHSVIENIHYYAYDPSNKYASCCKAVMKSCGIAEDHYFNDSKKLVEQVNGQANYVLLVNVLHEIDPVYWVEVFDIISQLLNQDGQLIIVEREELTVGEAPYHNGFLVLTEAGAGKLFGSEMFPPERHKQKDYIVKYTIPKSAISVTPDNVNECVSQIQEDSIKSIDCVKSAEADNDLTLYKNGIKLAFHLHQYANASLVLKYAMNEVKNS